MRVLITADFQADWSNLDLCEQAWSEILTICEERNLTHIVIAGDLKQVYNPVDIRVVRWWIRKVGQARQRGLTVVASLGNHDRIGQYTDTENWFPVLRKSGMFCFDKPAAMLAGDTELAFLPFRSDKEQLKREAKELAKYVRKNSVLIFHEDLHDCRHNKWGRKSLANITTDDLFCDQYLVCVGGHIHLPQKVAENVYYTGSPFAQDWGEANQQKSYTVICGTDVEFVLSKIPGWFDVDWPGFYTPKTGWSGTKVRVHAKCRSAVDYVSNVVHARVRAQNKYPGAEIYVVGTFEGGGIHDGGYSGVRTTDNDAVKIKAYVTKTCPENIQPEKVIRYLTLKLEEFGGRWTRFGTGVRFTKVSATNFLSFKKLDVDWNGKGIVIVQGKNQDRLGKSNGAGKTSVLQTIPVALFGTTFKGQKHDKWARRHATGVASVALELRDNRGREIRITRTRHPHRLQLWVDGKDQSSGLRGGDKSGTQGLIEQVTGFTWQTLANAVYIDQDIARAFISGTKKERTELLGKFQNLERFEKVGEQVKRDRDKGNVWYRDVQESLVVVGERIKGCERRLDLLLEESKERVREGWKEVTRRRKEWEQRTRELTPKIQSLEVKWEQSLTEYESETDTVEKAEWALSQLQAVLDRGQKDLKSLRHSIEYKECPTCYQLVDTQMLKKMEEKLQRDIQKFERSMDAARNNLKKVRVNRQLAEARHEELGIKVNSMKDELKRLEQDYNQTHSDYVEMRRREHLGTQGRLDTKKELELCRKKLDSLEKYQKVYEQDERFYEYCLGAVSRDGIPAFMNALLCQPLNIAADYYGELFGDNAVRVRFELENGEFVPVVLNDTGGEDISDQSTGEKALAGLIASFALREIAPKSNLLILDEPGEGLDPMAARQFAVGLKELKKKFDRIIVTTHNSAIGSELSDETTWVVKKQQGVSRLEV